MSWFKERLFSSPTIIAIWAVQKHRIRSFVHLTKSLPTDRIYALVTLSFTNYSCSNCFENKNIFHNPRAMRGGLLLLLPSTWSACPDHQGVPKWFRVSIGETMIGQKEGPRLRPWTILGDPTDHPTPNNGKLVDSPWQEDTLAIRLKQL